MLSRPLHIAFVAADLSTGGGVNRVIRDLSALLAAKLGHRVTIVSARSSAAPSYAHAPGVAIEYHSGRSLAAYVNVLLMLRKRRPDVVIGSWTQDNVLLTLAFLASRSRVVLVEHQSWFFHGALVRLARRLAYPLAWRVLVLNPSELDHYRRFLKRVRLLPNPVEELPLPDAPREKLILAVGHLEPRKNFADALRAFAASGLERDGWSLEIVGQGPERPRLEALIGELGLTRARIAEPVGDLSGHYARASMLAVTSTIEVFSLVLAEAMSAGVVPVAYAADGPKFVLDGFGDHLVPVGDVPALEAALRRFASASDDGLRLALRRSVAERFGPDVIAEKWRELLE